MVLRQHAQPGICTPHESVSRLEEELELDRKRLKLNQTLTYYSMETEQ